MKHIKILPVLIVVLALSFGLRIGAIFSDDGNHSNRAHAEESGFDISSLADIIPAAGGEEEPRTVETQAESSGGSDSTEADTSGNAPGLNTLGAAPPQGQGEEWRDSDDETFEYSEVRMELFEDLSRRRAALDEQEKEIRMREALLSAAEQEIDQKYRELLSLREEIQALLETQSEEEEKRVASLVKIYEGMKAKDAARIFNTLDTDVLLQVLGRMSERKSAPILAAMEADRARMVTILLAEQKALPDMGNLLNQ